MTHSPQEQRLRNVFDKHGKASPRHDRPYRKQLRSAATPVVLRARKWADCAKFHADADEKWPDDDAEQGTNPLAFAPDLCVEVLFGNAVCAASLDSRTHAYLCSGAEEVIVVGADGTVEFRGREGMRSRSVFDVTLAFDTCLLPYGRAATVHAAAPQR